MSSDTTSTNYYQQIAQDKFCFYYGTLINCMAFTFVERLPSQLDQNDNLELIKVHVPSLSISIFPIAYS